MNTSLSRIMRSAALVFLLGCVPALYAQEKPRKDHSTRPDVYYLNEGDVANSLYLLPPPPEGGSILFLYDKERYDWGKLQRNTPRGDQAAADANVEANGVPEAFSDAFGIAINETNTPEVLKLVIGMREDAGDLATREAKNY